MLTGLRIMARMAETGRSLQDLASVMTVLPQILINVPVADKAAVAASNAVSAAVAEEESGLGATGRVLLRPSGTEQLVRVMVEAQDPELAREVAERLAEVVAADLTSRAAPHVPAPQDAAGAGTGAPPPDQPPVKPLTSLSSGGVEEMSSSASSANISSVTGTVSLIFASWSAKAA